MNLTMDDKAAENYKSNSQKIRVITEQWVSNNLFCPYCGKEKITHFENNRPVADFYCPDCAEEYELKSKNGTIENKVNDGAYDTMIKRIESINNPNFFFMNYNKQDLHVKDFLMVPRSFGAHRYTQPSRTIGAVPEQSQEAGVVAVLQATINTLQGQLSVKDQQIEELNARLAEVSSALLAAQQTAAAAQALHAGTIQQQFITGKAGVEQQGQELEPEEKRGWFRKLFWR